MNDHESALLLAGQLATEFRPSVKAKRQVGRVNRAVYERAAARATFYAHECDRTQLDELLGGCGLAVAGQHHIYVLAGGHGLGPARRAAARGAGAKVGACGQADFWHRYRALAGLGLPAPVGPAPVLRQVNIDMRLERR